MPDENDQNLNPGQSDYERKTAFNPSGKKVNENSDQNTTANDLRNYEENPNGDYINNFDGKNTQKKQGVFSKIFKSKKGASITIVGGLATVIGVIGFFGSPALITQTILANYLHAFNTPQETSLSRRYSRMISSKLAGEATTGECNIIKIACRYTRPSNAFLKKLDKYGLKAYDKNGALIGKSSSPFPNARPVKYTFTGTDGKTIDIEAKNIYKEFVNNSEFRSAFNNASRMRFASLTDSVFKKIKARFGFSLANKLRTVNTDEDLAKQVDGENSVNNEIKAAAAEASDKVDDAADNAMKEVLIDGADKEIDKLARAGKGDAVGLAAGAVCLVSDIPKLATSTARSYQMMQLVKYSAVFLSAFGAIKAGDATPAEMTTVGNTLTKVVDGKSAMDSFGMKNTISGSKIPADNNYKKFVPGIGAILAFAGANAVLQSQLKTNACSVMTNPVTGQAINVAMAGSVVALPAAIANIVLGEVLARGAQVVLPAIIGAVIHVIPTEKILSLFYGDLTQNLSGEAVGDALTSGASHIMGQTGNAGGNMPLSVDDAIAYQKVSDEVELAYAEEDRATKSPFDTSSPNTFMGSIVQKITPYYINSTLGLSSIATKMGSMVNMIFGSFGSLLKPVSTSAITNDKIEYQLCEDPSIKDNDIAAGPYCNIIYGIPAQYLDIDPVTVVNELIKSGDIDENTGAIIEDSDLSDWMELCTDGTSNQANNCKITDIKTAYYALYTIDSRVIEAMDGAQEKTNTYDNKTAQELAAAIIAKGTVTDNTGQIAEVAAGTRTDIDIEVLKLIANLSQNNTFTISSLKRNYIPTNGSETSYHLSGKAVDISGSNPINGNTLNYSDYNTETQKFINEASSLLGSTCQIGLPNNLYVMSTKRISNCNVFTDIGTGAHIHFAVGGY
jgi:hypothetical protein